jgi:septal ring factor EnvC (AmiA/AmiB activator)
VGLKLKSSLWGYDPVLMDDEIELQNLEFDKEYKKLNEELQNAEKENSSIKMSIKSLEDEIATIKNLESEIGKKLLKVHMDASFRVFQSIRKFKIWKRKSFRQYQHIMKK